MSRRHAGGSAPHHLLRHDTSLLQALQWLQSAAGSAPGACALLLCEQQQLRASFRCQRSG